MSLTRYSRQWQSNVIFNEDTMFYQVIFMKCHFHSCHLHWHDTTWSRYNQWRWQVLSSFYHDIFVWYLSDRRRCTKNVLIVVSDRRCTSLCLHSSIRNVLIVVSDRRRCTFLYGADRCLHLQTEEDASIYQHHSTICMVLIDACIFFCLLEHVIFIDAIESIYQTEEDASIYQHHDASMKKTHW